MGKATAPPESSSPLRFTADDLQTLPDESDYELVDGQLVERCTGFEFSFFGGEILALLRNHVRARGLGWVLPADMGYQCFPDDPDKVRRPDASFISANRLRVTDLPKGYYTISPDLAVEVISPNDIAYELSRKVTEYLAAGIRLVWVLDPSIRRVYIYRQSGRDSVLSPTTNSRVKT